MGILKFKFEKLVVLGIPKTLLLKCFTIELLTLQWGLSRDRVPTSPMDCHHDVPHLNGHILRVLPPFSEIYQDPIVGIFGSIYIYSICFPIHIPLVSCMCPIQMALFSFTSATTSDGPVAPTQDRRRTNPPASPKRLIQNSEQKKSTNLGPKKT